MVEKNRIALELMKKNSVHVNDLYGFIMPQLAKVQNPKDVHFNGGSYEVLVQQVAREIEKVLKVKVSFKKGSFYAY